MSRPKKQTVDYFPHHCNHKKTMFILEQRYGNDGYAFWFKLLETLGKNEGHFIDLRNEADWEFLTSLTRLNDETCEEMLNLLSKLGAIDKELWAQRIVWSQNFVDNVAEAYRNRVVNLPKRPDNLLKKSASGEVSDVRNPNQTVGNPQSKVNESKVDKSTKSSKAFADDSPEMFFATTLKSFILTNNPKAKTPEDLQKWAAVFDKMLRIDKRSLEDIESVIEYSQTDNFWMTNILSPGKLREQFDKLYLQSRRKPRGDPQPKQQFTHQHPVTDLQKVIQRKTMVGIKGGGDP